MLVWIQTSWAVLIFWAAPFSAQNRSSLHSVNESSLLVCSTGLACFAIWLLITMWKSGPAKSSCKILYSILWNKTSSNCFVNQFYFFILTGLQSHLLSMFWSYGLHDKMLIFMYIEYTEGISTWSETLWFHQCCKTEITRIGRPYLLQYTSLWITS